MKCEDCGNFKDKHPDVTCPDKQRACQNFKPKAHPLDEIIEDIVCTSCNGRSYAGLKNDLEKLRYESFIEGWKACNCDSAYSFPGEYLMANGLGNWITKEQPCANTKGHQ